MTEARASLLKRLGLLAVLCVVLGVLARDAASRVRVQGAIEQVCALEDAGRDAEAVASSDGLIAELHEGQASLLAGCRCPALVKLGRAGDCLPLVEQIDASEEIPQHTALTAMVVAMYADDDAEAIRWADIVAERFPPTAESLAMEVVVRLEGGTATEVARVLAPRFAALPPEDARQARLVLAQRLQKEGEVDAALAMLEPPDTADLEGWFFTRNQMLALAGRQMDVVKSFERWQSMGGDPRRLQLEYALVLETAGLKDGARDPVQLYRDGIAGADPVRDRDLIEAAYARLTGTFMMSGQPEAALSVFNEARNQGYETGFTEDELQRMTRTGDGEVAGVGRLVFRLPGRAAGDQLRVAPADAEAADTPYTVVPLDRDEVSLSRAAGPTPVRWVWSDSDGRPLASGVSWPGPDKPVIVAIADRPQAPASVAAFSPTIAPADGDPNVYVLILDCGDWRLIRYLQARGEMPTLTALEARGTAGVLTSIPAMTGTAMEKVVHPRSESTFTLLSYLHHMGAELGGLASIGENPIEEISWVLKEYPYIFDLAAAANRVSANMLFSHGGKVSVGRNAELIGPGDRREMLTGLTWQRGLRPEELAALPGLREAPEYVLDMAAEFDAGAQLIRRRDIDLLLLRIEPLDLMTHAHYGETTRSGRDDGLPMLYQTYRYVDQRLADIVNAIDGDDTLIVMSDHGIQATMLHDPEAYFVAVGPRLAPGRLSGQPEIAGVARLLLDALGVPVPASWPDTGLSVILK